MRRLSLLAVLVVGLLAASAGNASATRWSGNCSMKGYTALLRPSRLAPAPHGYLISTKGTCTGSLDHRAYKGPGVFFVDGRMNRPMSCEFGESTNIPGSLTFPARRTRKHRATTVDLLVQESNILNELPLAVSGAYNGFAWAHGTYPSDFNSLKECAGAGVKRLEMTLDISTLQELYG